MRMKITIFYGFRLEGLLNENNSSGYGAHVDYPLKPRGKGVDTYSSKSDKSVFFEKLP